MKHIFLEGPVDEIALRDKTRIVVKSRRLNQLDMDVIQEIHQEHGVCVSSMTICECIQQDLREQAFQKALKHAKPQGNPRLHLVVIPTMYYSEHPELGGSGEVFQMIAKRLSIKVSVIQVKSLGCIQENSKIIADFINALKNSDNVWILAISKGTADVKHAFLNHISSKAMNKVKGIINISGMPGGTPLTGKGAGISVGYHVIKHWLKIRGGDYSIVDEMFTEHPFSKAYFKLPETIRIINIIGVPIMAYLRKPVCNSFHQLAKQGPNDGCVLLKDALIPNGNTIALWGVDHYMRAPSVAKWAECILNWLTNQRYD